MTKILCVEDEAEIRQDIAEELNEAGYETCEAANGQQGLEAILQQKPDLVISDISMPVMDGHDLLLELRSKHPDFAEMPFIFLSALADPGQVVRGRKLGADDYLTKPIDFDLLLATIESQIKQIERMKAHKEEQLVKLYRSLNEQGAGGQAREEPLPFAVTEPLEGPGPAAQSSLQSAFFKAMAKRSGGKVLAGQIRIVGLDEIKLALGGQWQQRFERIRAIAEGMIRKHLSKEDVFELRGDDKFVICFVSLDEKAAALKAQTIARDIRQALLGDDGLEPRVKACCDVASDVHEVHVAAGDLKQVDDVVGIVAARVDEAGRAAHRREIETLERMVETGGILQTPILGANGAAVPLALAIFDPETRAEIAALRDARPGSEELESELDILRLGKASELLCDFGHRTQPILLVDVGFSTLSRRDPLASYLKICASLTEPTIGHLVLNLRGLPKGYVCSSALQLLNPLRRYCRQVALELGELSLGAIDPEALRTPILTGDHQALISQPGANPESLKRLLGEIHGAKARLLIREAPTREDALGLLSQGVDLVAVRS